MRSRATATFDTDSMHTTLKRLADLHRAEAACKRCSLYAFATQVVPGQGPARASLMLIGEQPGDKEDLEGKPFVGPAGKILDRALVQAEISRQEVFVTNAVKHFKHEMRGKRRIHKRPNAHEIDRCRWWVDQERSLVTPATIVTLGATAARTIFGRTVTIAAMRGRAHPLDDGTPVFVTIHPSLLLRIRDTADKERAFCDFVADLRLAKETSRQGN